MIGRLGQARYAAADVEAVIHCAERCRGWAVGAVKQGFLIAPAFALRADPDRRGRNARRGPVAAQLNAEARAVENLASIRTREQRGEDARRFAEDHFVDEDFIGDVVGLVGDHLPPADELCRFARHRFENVPVTLLRQAEGCGVEFKRLDRGLRHQRAGHAGVVVEMAFVEPGVGRHP